MKITLSLSMKTTLKLAHSHERDVRTCDKIKTVLLSTKDLQREENLTRILHLQNRKFFFTDIVIKNSMG